MASGRVIVPLNAVAGDVQLRHVLDHSDVAAVFVVPQYKDKLQALLKDVSRPVQVVSLDQNSGPAWAEFDSTGASSANQEHGLPAADDPALLLYTSGSTGLPKGALLSHRAIVQGGKNVELGHNLTASDRALCVLPIYHINGAMVTVAAPLVSGGSVVMPARFSAKSFWPMVENHRCTWSSIVPTIIKYLLDRANQEPYQFGTDDRLARFRFARSASAPLAATVLMQWEDTFHVPMLGNTGTDRDGRERWLPIQCHHASVNQGRSGWRSAMK